MHIFQFLTGSVLGGACTTTAVEAAPEVDLAAVHVAAVPAADHEAAAGIKSALSCMIND